MRAYRSLQALLAAIFAAYLVLAVAEVAIGEKGLVFPATSWALFERVPNRFTTYAVRVESLDGRELRPARDLVDLAPVLPGAASLEARTTVRTLGTALAAGDRVGITRARRTLDRLHLAGRPVRYAIEERVYEDPRIAWHGGAPVARRTIATFASERRGG